MANLTDAQHDELHDLYLEMAKNPTEKLLTSTLKQLGVWVWGNYVANLDILDTSKEPSLSGRDLARMEEAEHTWISEHIDDVIEEGKTPKLTEKSPDDDIKFYSSQLFPVEDGLLQTVSIIINTFDAFVMDDAVWNNSFFKQNLPSAYDYQLIQMDAWEDQYIEEDEE